MGAGSLAAPTSIGTPELARSLRRVESRRRWTAIALTLPLLVFLLVTLLVPIGALLVRAVENPEVARSLPLTGAALARWDRKTEPPAAAFALAGPSSRIGRRSRRTCRAGRPTIC
jgi:putative spermidine/putrescine transport system permease protein